MSCLGVTGKSMVVTCLGRSGNPRDERNVFLPFFSFRTNMDNIWTMY